MFCDYKDLFGKVGTGLHSVRIFNIAIVDVLLTVGGAYIIHLLYPKLRFIYILAGLFLLGIALHQLFCVKTTVDRILFS